MTWARVLAVGLASEIDLSQTVAARRRYATGLAAETDASLAASAAKAQSIGQAEEADTALQLGEIVIVAGLAIESDIALPATVLLRYFRPAPRIRVITVPRDDRSHVLAADPRRVALPRERRTIVVPPDNRNT